MKKETILVIGACGRLGAALTAALREQQDGAHIIAADRDARADILLDVLDHRELRSAVRECGVTQIYLLTETNGENAWRLNVQSLLAVLNVAREASISKVFWPSNIAVFGPGSPKYNCPQQTRIEPHSVYGISKRTGEYWCNHYFECYGIDVRSLRLPSLVSPVPSTGGDVAGYAGHMLSRALENYPYTCFLSEDNCLPMIFLADAVRAITELMAAPAEALGTRTSYNIAGMSFAPCDLVAAIRNHVPGFTVSYQPDYRDAMATARPASIKDEQARRDWGWKPVYDLSAMTAAVLNRQFQTEDIYTTAAIDQ